MINKAKNKLFRSLILISCILIPVFNLIGCVPMAQPRPQQTSLELRSIQTRTFNINDPKRAMKAVLNTLQDDGFIVKNAVVELGLLTATKESDLENRNERVFKLMLGGREARWRKNSVIEASINVSEHDSAIRVRSNFQIKIIDNMGNIIKIDNITDPTYYQNFFSKVDKGIFIENNNL